MDKIKKSIINLLLTNNVIQENQIDIYNYGIEIFVSTLFFVLSGLIVSFLIGSFGNAFIFMIVWLCLRSLIGGIHTQTRNSCYIMSLIIFVTASYLSQFINKDLSIIFSITSFVLIALIAPVGHEHRPMSKEYTKKIRALAILVSGAFMFLTIGLYFTKFNTLISPISFSMFTNSMLMLSGFIRNKVIAFNKRKI